MERVQYMGGGMDQRTEGEGQETKKRRDKDGGGGGRKGQKGASKWASGIDKSEDRPEGP
jgi:hypothetical protein